MLALAGGLAALEPLRSAFFAAVLTQDPNSAASVPDLFTFAPRVLMPALFGTVLVLAEPEPRQAPREGLLILSGVLLGSALLMPLLGIWPGGILDSHQPWRAYGAQIGADLAGLWLLGAMRAWAVRRLRWLSAWSAILASFIASMAAALLGVAAGFWPEAFWTEALAADGTAWALGWLAAAPVFAFYVGGRTNGEAEELNSAGHSSVRSADRIPMRHEISESDLERSLQRRIKEIESIRTVASEMIAQHGLPALLQSIVERATLLLEGSGGGMYLCDPEARKVRCVVSYQTDRDYVGTVLEYGEGAAGVVAETGEALLIQDYRQWSRRAKAFERRQPFRRVISAPMRWQDEVIGVIHVLRDENDPVFGEDDVELLSLFANQASVVLKNAQLLEDVERRARLLTRLNDLTRAALSSQDQGTLLEEISDRIAALISADKCLVSIWDEKRQRGVFSVTADEYGDGLPALIESNEPGLTSRVLSAGKALTIDASRWRTGDGGSAVPEAIIGLPIFVGDQWYGALFLIFEDEHHFSDLEMQICEQAAAQVSLAMAKTRALDGERRRSQELEALRKASLSLTSRLELRPVLETILSLTLDLVDADDAHIFLYDGEKLSFGAALWLGEGEREPYTKVRESGLTYTVARSGERVVISNANAHPLYKDWRWGGAIVGLPLKIGERVVGVMNVALMQPHEFDAAELRALELFADQAAIMIENARLFESVDRERRSIRLLLDVAQELAHTLDEDEILERAVELTVNALGALFGEALLLEPDGRTLVARSLFHSEGEFPPDTIERIRMPVTEGIGGWVVRNREPVLVDDVQKDDRWVKIEVVDEGVQSGVFVPLIVGTEVCGELAVFQDHEAAFQDDHVKLMTAISQQIGLAMLNARSYQQTRRRLAEIEAVRQVLQVVNRRLEMTPLLQEAVEQVGDLLGYPVVEIYLVYGDELRLGAAYGISTDISSVSYKLSEGILGRVASTNRPAFVDDVQQDPDYIVGWPETICEIVVPLRKEDVVIGVLNVESPTPGGLVLDDMRLLTTLADQLAVAIENAALYERLRRHAANLESLIKERTSELAEALDQAQAADRLKTQFVSDVSHELRTPLANIRLYLGLMARGRRDRFDAYLKTLNRETDRLVTLIEDLLTISRMDAGTVTPDRQLMDINDLARGLVEDRRQLFADKDLRLKLLLDHDLPKVEGDERMISQVVANLMTNSLHYTPAGGEVTITTRMQSDGGPQPWATLTVADNGLGIPEKEQVHIFERFFRGSASRQMGTPGTGLGLAICKEILQRHGGKITLSSREGRGSAFTIWLPARD